MDYTSRIAARGPILHYEHDCFLKLYDTDPQMLILSIANFEIKKSLRTFHELKMSDVCFVSFTNSGPALIRVELVIRVPTESKVPELN